MHSYTCTEVLVVKLLLCYLFANIVFKIYLYPHDASQKDSQKCRPFIKRNSQQEWNATSPAVSTTLKTRSSQRRTTDATSGVGSASPPVKRQQRSQSTNQSSEDPASGHQLLTAQNMSTITQAILDAFPSWTSTPVQLSNAEVVPSPGTSRDDVPSKLLVS